MGVKARGNCTHHKHNAVSSLIKREICIREEGGEKERKGERGGGGRVEEEERGEERRG